MAAKDNDPSWTARGDAPACSIVAATCCSSPARSDHLGCRRGRRRFTQLPVGRDGRPPLVGVGCARAAPTAACWWLTGERRDADGAGSLATSGVQMSAEFGSRSVRQCPLRRDRHAAEPHRLWRESVGRRAQAAASRAFTTSPTMAGALTISPADPHRRPRTLFARIRSGPARPAARAAPSRDGCLLKNRFRHALGVDTATFQRLQRAQVVDGLVYVIRSH